MIQIKFSNKTAYTLIAIAVLLIGLGVVFAYRSGSQPSVLGHSAEELEVNISGTIMTLQQAINQGNLSGGEVGCIWRLSHPKDTTHGHGWINVTEVIAQKPTGICTCGNTTNIAATLSISHSGGYMETHGNADARYWICDDDSISGCGSSYPYFVYLTCA